MLLSANPTLTPTQIRHALQATADPILDANGAPRPFWQVGYGYVNLSKAVALVRGSGWKRRLAHASANADARVLASDGYRVIRSDWWSYDAPRVAAGGSDAHEYSVSVPSSVAFLKISLAHPSGSSVGINLMECDVTVKDASDKVIGTSADDLTQSTGTASAFIDFSKVSGGVAFGTFTIDVSGFQSASDPDTLDSDSDLGRTITLEVAQVNAGS